MAAKETKGAVNYRLGGDHCHACVHFTEGQGETEIGTCELVEGPIGEHMLCNLFKREGEMRGMGGMAKYAKKK